MTMYALIRWEDGYVDVLALSRILEPRKDFSQYKVGDQVKARWGKGLFKADILEISDKRAELMKQINGQHVVVDTQLAETQQGSRPVEKAGSRQVEKAPRQIEVPIRAASKKKTPSTSKKGHGDILRAIEDVLQSDSPELNAKGYPTVAAKAPRSRADTETCPQCQVLNKRCQEREEDILHLQEELDHLNEKADADKIHLAETTRDLEETRVLCTSLQREVNELKEQLSTVNTERHVEDSSACARPRAGVVSPAEAEKFSMVELAPGSGVYVYEAQFHQAINKCGAPSRRDKTRTHPVTSIAQKDGRSAARYLMNVLYSMDDLVGGSLTTSSQVKLVTADGKELCLLDDLDYVRIEMAPLLQKCWFMFHHMTIIRTLDWMVNQTQPSSGAWSTLVCDITVQGVEIEDCRKRQRLFVPTHVYSTI